MSRYTPERLYELLPAVYRQRDAELGYVLRDLVTVLAEQAMVLEADVARLAESWFIETCEPRVVPYLGDWLGVRGTPPLGVDQRAEVANTLGYRRRKGTLPVLEGIARDVSGWPARAVEFFELLGATQFLNHLRPHCLRTPDVRQVERLEHLGGPFETAAHTVDVRLMTRGKYNIANIGIYLWRLTAYPLSWVTPRRVDPPAAGPTPHRYTFNVLHLDEPLFTDPDTEADRFHLAEEINVPAPIRRRAFHARPGLYYGPGRSIEVRAWGLGTVPPDKEPQVLNVNAIIACDLSDWERAVPDGSVAIDPVRGRLAFGADLDPTAVEVRYAYGFSADLGGGPYERQASFTDLAGERRIEVRLGKKHETLATALKDWGETGSAVIEIQDSRTYHEAIPPLAIPADARLAIRAKNGERPLIVLEEDLRVAGGSNSTLELNGLLIADRPVRLRGGLERARILHCTLAPARNLGADKKHLPSLFVRGGLAEVTVERSIVGTVRSDPDASVGFVDTILDATPPQDAVDPPHVAFGGVGGGEGGTLRVVRCTVIGSVHARDLTLAENSIFLAPVTAARRQAGCVRFCWVHPDSQVPRRFHCLPEAGEGSQPRFTSLRYGDPGYCQLTADNPEAVLRLAADESSPGAFSSLHEPQRGEYLRLRLEEYLRVGLEVGIFFVT